MDIPGVEVPYLKLNRVSNIGHLTALVGRSLTVTFALPNLRIDQHVETDGQLGFDFVEPPAGPDEDLPADEDSAAADGEESDEQSEPPDLELETAAWSVVGGLSGD